MKPLETKEEIISYFNWQIRNNPRFQVDKELFNLTFDFTSKDWAKIRTKEFWAARDSIQTEHDKKVYLLQCVRNYLR